MITSTQTLTTSAFYQVVRKLNPNFRVACGNDESRLAGLYLLKEGGVHAEDICGVDKSYVPAYATFDVGGHIIKSGWRRVIHILLAHRYISLSDVKKVCPGFFDSRAMGRDRFTGGEAGDPIANKIESYAAGNFCKDPTNDAFTGDQLVDVAESIRAKDSQEQKAVREHDIWFLEQWKKNGGGPKDRPNY